MGNNGGQSSWAPHRLPRTWVRIPLIVGLFSFPSSFPIQRYKFGQPRGNAASSFVHHYFCKLKSLDGHSCSSVSIGSRIWGPEIGAPPLAAAFFDEPSAVLRTRRQLSLNRIRCHISRNKAKKNPSLCFFEARCGGGTSLGSGSKAPGLNNVMAQPSLELSPSEDWVLALYLA